MIKPNNLEWRIKLAERELEVAKENLNRIQQHLFLLKAEKDQQKERKNVNKWSQHNINKGDERWVKK